MTKKQRKKQFHLEYNRNPICRDLNNIIYYKYNKSGHFTDKCKKSIDNTMEK